MKAITLLLLTFVALLPAMAVAAKPFERLDGCRLLANRWNDGDSFHVATADGREIIVRLYFVDAPESKISYAERTGDQAAYFAISEDRQGRHGFYRHEARQNFHGLDSMERCARAEQGAAILRDCERGRRRSGRIACQ